MHTIHIIMLNNCSTHTNKYTATHTLTTTLNACIYAFMKYINIYIYEYTYVYYIFIMIRNKKCNYVL